jgi:hypothetical protein
MGSVPVGSVPFHDSKGRARELSFRDRARLRGLEIRDIPAPAGAAVLERRIGVPQAVPFV